MVQGEYLSKIHRQELLEDIQDAEQEDAQPIEDDSPSPVKLSSKLMRGSNFAS